MIQFDNNFMINVGKRLKALRKQHSLTAGQLAEKLSKNYIGMSEKAYNGAKTERVCQK